MTNLSTQIASSAIHLDHYDYLEAESQFYQKLDEDID